MQRHSLHGDEIIPLHVLTSSNNIYAKKQGGQSLCPSVLCVCNNRSSCVASSSLVSTSFLLLSLLCLLQRWRRNAFLLLLQAAQGVRIALFPLPLLPPPLSVLLGNALLLFQALDALLLGRAHQLSQLDGLDVVQGRLAGFVQHDGVKDDIKQRNAWDLLQACSYCVVLENTQTHQQFYSKGSSTSCRFADLAQSHNTVQRSTLFNFISLSKWHYCDINSCGFKKLCL